ncbi:MAG: pyridoxal-phosphate dependent enzyme [Thermoplasmata archaeon]|nr:pyridoxal-phosphate dependent enzyme [Thermoplasmata archaeon]
MSSQINKQIPTIDDVLEARERIKGHVKMTPVLTSSSIDEMTGAVLFFKCENFQRVGAFKFRGACNAVFSLSEEEAKNGVATHSSGNHAQALALAARERGIKAYIVMPSTAPKVKVEGVRGYGGEIIFCEPTLEARERGLAEVIERTAAHFIHPYDDPRVIAGQATAALELVEKVKDLDIVMAPVGGGGLLSGTSIAVKSESRGTTVYAAEPAGADDAYRSIREGVLLPSVEPRTIADGLLTSLSALTFRIISSNVDEILQVDEENIILAMRHIWERMKVIVEPSAAVPLGAVLQHGNIFKGKRVGIILSGGNVDLTALPW